MSLPGVKKPPLFSQLNFFIFLNKDLQTLPAAPLLLLRSAY
jgi:hypothetical protein